MNTKMNISPSLASANPLCLEQEVKRLALDDYADLHIDIEDGNFIPNITFGMRTVKALRAITDKPFSFHLMVANPFDYLDELAECGASIVFAHIEALDYPALFVEAVRKRGVRAGLACNPRTQLEPCYYAIDRVDAILIMTSEPDGLGQRYLPSMEPKIERLKAAFPALEIWIDGGVTPARLERLSLLGATHAVMGRAIFGSIS